MKKFLFTTMLIILFVSSYAQTNCSFTFELENSTFCVTKKGLVKRITNIKETTIIGTEWETNSDIDRVKYYKYNNFLLLELGINDFEGYFYTVFIIDLTNNSYWMFNDTCSNWDEFYYIENGKIYYACEYKCNYKNYLVEIDVKNKKSKDINNPKDCFSKRNKKLIIFNQANKRVL